MRDPCPAAREALVEPLALAGFDTIAQAIDLAEARERLEAGAADAADAAPWLSVLEPLGLPGQAEAQLSHCAARNATVLRCSAAPIHPGDLCKPVPQADWRAALRRPPAAARDDAQRWNLPSEPMMDRSV